MTILFLAVVVSIFVFIFSTPVIVAEANNEPVPNYKLWLGLTGAFLAITVGGYSFVILFIVFLVKAL